MTKEQQIPTVRECERVLRYAGLSRREAKRVLHEGFASLHEHLDDDTRVRLLAMAGRPNASEADQ